MESYSEKAQLAKYKAGFGSSAPTKLNRTPAMTFAQNSYAPEVKAKLSNYSKITGQNLGPGWKASR